MSVIYIPTTALPVAKSLTKHSTKTCNLHGATPQWNAIRIRGSLPLSNPTLTPQLPLFLCVWQRQALNPTIHIIITKEATELLGYV